MELVSGVVFEILGSIVRTTEKHMSFKDILENHVENFVLVIGKYCICNPDHTPDTLSNLLYEDRQKEANSENIKKAFLISRTKIPQIMRRNNGKSTTPNIPENIIFSENPESNGEKKIHNAISALILAEKDDFNCDINEFVFLVDQMRVALNVLTDLIGIEDNDASSLIKRLNSTFENAMNDGFGTYIEEDDDEPNNLEFISTDMNYSGMMIDLASIPEDKSNKEKITKYVNIIFPRLFLSYTLNAIDKLNITFAQWFHDVMLNPKFKKDNIVKEKYYRIVHKNNFDINDNERVLALKFLLSSDFDFWAEIINSTVFLVSHNVNYKWLYETIGSIDSEYLFSVSFTLKAYRNDDAHSGNIDFSNEDLVRVLTILTLFAKKAELPIEASMIEKRLCYERYCCYSVRGDGWLPTSYSEIDFSSYPAPNYNSLPCWKNIVTRKEYSSTIVFPADAKSSELNAYITERLFDFTADKDKIVKTATKFFQKYSVMLPAFISGQSFEEYFRNCYPFHPAFFLLLREKIKTSPGYVYALARTAVERAYEDPNYSNAFIMPYEIDINIKEGLSENDKSINDLLVEKFAFGTLREMFPWRLVPNPHGWQFLENQFLKNDSYIETLCMNCEVNFDMVKKITFVILLLGLHSLYIKGCKDNNNYDRALIWRSGILPNREWIRFCLIKNDITVSEIEKAIKFIPFSVYYINHHQEVFDINQSNTKIKEGFYEFFIPSKEKENVEKFFARIGGSLVKQTPEIDFSKLDEIYDKERARDKEFAIAQHTTIKPEEKTKYTDDMLGYFLEDLDIRCNENKELARKEFEYQMDFLTYLKIQGYFNESK